MIAKIAESRLHEYVSIQHLGHIMFDKNSQQLVTTMLDAPAYENYTFTARSDDETKIDVEMTAVPDEWADMMNDMWPKALELLKDVVSRSV
jgi:hypothetical protein